jgi:hypothetical protein
MAGKAAVKRVIKLDTVEPLALSLAARNQDFAVG